MQGAMLFTSPVEVSITCVSCTAQVPPTTASVGVADVQPPTATTCWPITVPPTDTRALMFELILRRDQLALTSFGKFEDSVPDTSNCQTSDKGYMVFPS